MTNVNEEKDRIIYKKNENRSETINDMNIKGSNSQIYFSQGKGIDEKDKHNLVFGNTGDNIIREGNINSQISVMGSNFLGNQSSLSKAGRDKKTALNLEGEEEMSLIY